MGRIVKLLLVLVIVFIAWKVVWPKITERTGAATGEASATDGSCVRAAEQASETWGSGLRQFVNPPYDLDAWSSLRDDVDSKARDAQTACGCAAESCSKASGALRDLRGLVAEMDSAMRGGLAPPGDLVQRQESIDNRINDAAELVRDGK